VLADLVERASKAGVATPLIGLSTLVHRIHNQRLGARA
jgi:hypothetical protein